MHKSLITSIKTFTYGIEDEKKKMKAIRKTILMISKKADENCPPIDLSINQQGILLNICYCCVQVQV